MFPINLSASLRPEWMPPAMPGPAAGAAAPEGLSFQGMLQGALSETAGLEQNAQTMIGRSLAGDESVSQVEVLTAVKKADLSMRMMLQIRNTLMEAYNEIKGMQF
jgi:flagellar hook-basal body complex protein FliE